MSTMKYRDLKEMTFNEWDGKPFRAIVTDHDEETLFISDKRRYDGEEEGVLVTGYDNERWRIGSSGLHWKHAYPLEWNKKPKKRMTNRQLAMWLAKGNGEVTMNIGCSVLHHFDYGNEEANELILASIRVRKWDSEEWIEPTTDLLEEY